MVMLERAVKGKKSREGRRVGDRGLLLSSPLAESTLLTPSLPPQSPFDRERISIV